MVWTPHRALALAVALAGPALLPLSGCGTDTTPTQPAAGTTAPAGVSALDGAKNTLDRAAFAALQRVKASATVKDPAALFGLIAASDTQFRVAVAQVRAAVAHGAAARALRERLLSLAAPAVADYDAAKATGATDLAALRETVARLQLHLGAILAAPA